MFSNLEDTAVGHKEMLTIKKGSVYTEPDSSSKSSGAYKSIDAFITTSLRWYHPDQVQRVKEIYAFFSQSELSDPPSRALETIYYYETYLSKIT